jgi:hypothetical protein
MHIDDPVAPIDPARDEQHRRRLDLRRARSLRTAVLALALPVLALLAGALLGARVGAPVPGAIGMLLALGVGKLPLLALGAASLAVRLAASPRDATRRRHRLSVGLAWLACSASVLTTTAAAALAGITCTWFAGTGALAGAVSFAAAGVVLGLLGLLAGREAI